MRRRFVVILLVASVMGLLASLLVYRVLNQVVAAAAGQNSHEQIVVAAANMNLADTVSPQHVKLMPWPKTSVPDGAFRSLKEVEGRVVRSSIVAGEPLMEGKLAPHLSGKGGIMPMLVPEGQRAVTIKVDDAVRESGFVLPNSRVDVLVSMAKTKTQDERIAKVILQDVLVLAAGQTVEMRDNKPVTVTTVTLSLTPEQTERLAVAQAEGKLTLAMRNLRDNQVVKTTGATPTALLSDAGAAAPRAPEPLSVATKPTPAPVRPRPAPAVVSAPLPAPKLDAHTVSVIRGGKVSEQTFVRQDGQAWVERNHSDK
jgi:pilus assembly protein CpaB